MQSSQQLTEKLHRAIQVDKLEEAKTLVKDGANMDLVLGNNTSLIELVHWPSHSLLCEILNLYINYVINVVLSICKDVEIRTMVKKITTGLHLRVL